MPPTFEELSLSPELLAVVAELGYLAPTPIQTASIPALLEGRDLIGQSKTGSGKTAAFALPILQRLDLDERALQALVVCPTRELCAQVAREVRKLGRRHAGLTVLELVGGQPARPQRETLARGAHIAIGTPGRLLDHLEREALRPQGLQTVVLDEADRMLDMGFGEDVRRILRALPRSRQTVLFSATLPDEIESLHRKYQQDAVSVRIEDPETQHAEIRQLVLAVDPRDKLRALYWLLLEHPHESALIFCNFKATVAELTRDLAASGFSVDRLDGDLDQFQRDQVLARFRNRSLHLLVATDVAGRGLDIEGLDLVVNFELPQKPEIYVHRIGRTGRASRHGVAASLASDPADERIRSYEESTGGPIETLTPDLSTPPSRARLDSIARPPEMLTILISGGRKDRVRPGDILGALTGSAGALKSAEVGKIEVRDKIAYVAVARRVARDAVAQLNQGRIKGKRFRATLIERSEPRDASRAASGKRP